MARGLLTFLEINAIYPNLYKVEKLWRDFKMIYFGKEKKIL